MTSKSSEKTESKLSCEELYEKNEKLAYQCLRRYYPQVWLNEDYQQEAKMALWCACRDYDPEKGAISTFAWVYIRNHMSKILRLENGVKKPKNVESLSEIIFEDGNGGNAIELEDIIASAPDVDWCDWKTWWNSLTERQRQILSLRFSGAKMKEMEKIVGVSRTIIAQETVKAKKKAERYL